MIQFGVYWEKLFVRQTKQGGFAKKCKAILGKAKIMHNQEQVNEQNFRPIYTGKRKFLGLKDLVISFYARKCPFQCSFCILPMKSHDGLVSNDSLKKQIDLVWAEYEKELTSFQQLSVGVEGSILDQERFPKEVMNYLLEQSKALSSLKVLSLETRPEYIFPATLENILNLTQAEIVDLTIGFETQEDYLREVILTKSINRKIFEKKIKILGEMGVRMTSYVLLKPGPTMTEEEGIQEAIATIEYLAEICQKFGTDLVIYLNPVYVAEGSPLAQAFAFSNYIPVRIQSVLEVILATRYLEVPIYTGLWSENNTNRYGDYTIHSDYEPAIRNAIKKFNQTQDISWLNPFTSSKWAGKKYQLQLT